MIGELFMFYPLRVYLCHLILRKGLLLDLPPSAMFTDVASLLSSASGKFHPKQYDEMIGTGNRVKINYILRSYSFLREFPSLKYGFYDHFSLILTWHLFTREYPRSQGAPLSHIVFTASRPTIVSTLTASRLSYLLLIRIYHSAVTASGANH